MGRFMAILCVMALATGACGGGGAGPDPTAGEGTSQNGELDYELLGFDTSFEADDLPDDFPSEYAPADIVAGQVAELGGHTTVSFYSDMSFDEALSFYEPLLGTPILVGNRGQRVATWVQVEQWGGGLFEEDPLLIAFTRVAG